MMLAPRALAFSSWTGSAPDPASAQKRSLLLGDAEYRLGRTTTALSHLRKVTSQILRFMPGLFGWRSLLSQASKSAGVS